MAESYPIEFERVIETLNETGVRYVIVGGVAVVLHGVDRLTADLDVVVDLEPTAALKVVEGLEHIGYQPRPPVEAREFADPEKRREWAETKNMEVLSFWDPGGNLPVLDIFIRYPLDFEKLMGKSIRVDIGGIVATVVSVDHLIEMKSATGRAKDEQDVDALRGTNDKS